MKKILTSLFAVMFFTATAYAEVRIGLSGAYSMFTSDGTETVKSSGTKNSKSHDEDVVVPSIFFEADLPNGMALGIDFIPAEAELGSATNARTDTDTDDSSDTAGNNEVSAELSGHTTLYVTYPIRGNGYVKGGVAIASIDTTETLATGSVYKNEDVTGIMIGAGYNREGNNGLFFRSEVTYTNYDSVNFKGSLDADSVRNEIDADIDVLALRLSVGKAF